MIEGDIPCKGQSLVTEWAALYQKELHEIWNTQIFKQLPPL